MIARRLMLLVVLSAFALPASASAATFQVDTTADAAAAANACTTTAVPGQTCSLREAVAAANADTAADIINLPAGTYVLGGALAPTSPVTIAGAGARSTVVSANNASRVFSIAPNSANGTYALQDFTITGGRSLLSDAGATPGDGGGILITSVMGVTLSLDRMTVTGNTAEMGGGGLANPLETTGTAGATVSVNRSTFSNNTAGTGAMTDAQGGGMLIFGDLTLTNSTITGNVANSMATGRGAGIVASPDVSTVATPVTATFVNSTISHNTATAGAGMMTGAGGVSGVLGTTNLVATNTIIANNTLNGTETDCSLVAAGAVANNISGDASCGFSGGANKPSTNPALGPLADNGGTTDTRAIALTGPAADAGTATGCPPTDQRGVARPQGSACDIGAFEAVPGATGTVGGGAGGTTPPRTTAGRKPTLKVSGVPRSCRRSKFEIRLRSGVSGTGVKLRSVKVTLNGKKLKTVTKAGRFRLKIDAKKLRAGKKYTLRVKATDSKGRATSFKKSFKRCKAKKKRAGKR